MNFRQLIELLNVETSVLAEALKACDLKGVKQFSDEEVERVERFIESGKAIEGGVVKGDSAQEEVSAESSENESQPDLSSMTEQQKMALYAELQAEIQVKNAGQALVNKIGMSYQVTANVLMDQTQQATETGFDLLMHAGVAGVTKGLIASAKKYQNLGEFNQVVFTQPQYTALPTVEDLKALMPSE